MLEEGVEGLGVSEREGGAGGSDTGARGGEIERMERERESGASDPLLAAQAGNKGGERIVQRVWARVRCRWTGWALEGQMGLRWRLGRPVLSLFSLSLIFPLTEKNWRDEKKERDRERISTRK